MRVNDEFTVFTKAEAKVFVEFAAHDETRTTASICFTPSEIVATDGHRLVRWRNPTPPDKPTSTQLLVPRVTLASAVKVAPARAELGVSENSIYILNSSLIEPIAFKPATGCYANYKNVTECEGRKTPNIECVPLNAQYLASILLVTKATGSDERVECDLTRDPAWFTVNAEWDVFIMRYRQRP